jgi:hypothetical protein
MLNPVVRIETARLLKDKIEFEYNINTSDILVFSAVETLC